MFNCGSILDAPRTHTYAKRNTTDDVFNVWNALSNYAPWRLNMENSYYNFVNHIVNVIHEQQNNFYFFRFEVR